MSRCPVYADGMPDSRGRYHHGDLRRALLDAAVALAREEGVDAVTLRAMARRVGVSHAAPAHHFADKAALVEALAVEGYGQFTAALRAAWEDTPGHCLQRLAGVGRAYVGFALRERELFRLINRPELRAGRGTASPSPVGEAAQECLAVLETAIRAGQDEGYLPSGSPAPWSLLAWSAVHGLSVLILDDLLAERVAGVQDELVLVDRLLLAMGHGLLVRDPTQDPFAGDRPP